MKNAPDVSDPLLLAHELAHALRISERTLRTLVQEGLPRIQVRERLYRYDLAEVRTWLANRQTATTPVEEVLH